MEKRTTLWLLAGCGVALALVAIGVLVGFGLVGRRTLQRFEEELRDPDVRRARTLERLSLNAVPPRYYPVLEGGDGAFQLAVFSDEGDLASPYHYGFAYVNLWNESDRSQLRPLFEGSADRSPLFGDSGAAFDIQLDEPMGQGAIETSGGTIRFRSAGGRVRLSQPFAGDHHLLSMMIFDCEKGPRYLVWFGPDPREPTWEGADETDPLFTSVANPAWIERFVSEAPLCDQGQWTR